jgi:hypothetical protein
MDLSPAAGVQTAAASHSTTEHDDGDLLQTLAHELRQPLSAIDSISYYLDLVLPREDSRAREQASRLHALVQQSSAILSCALNLHDTRPMQPQLLSLEELLTQAVVAARSSSAESNLRLELAGEMPPIPLDPQRGLRMIEHLLILFLPLSNQLHPAHIRTSLMEGTVLLEVSLAPSVPANEAAMGPGAGLAIESIRRTAEAHQGSFSFLVDQVSGVRARLLLPRSATE